MTIKFGEEASAFVRSHSDKPWFLYVAFNAPHPPHEPTQEREARFASIENVARRKYLAQISLMDDAIGQITSTLAETEQRDLTLVFFMSDNGGPVANGANNGPLRGTKGQLYEGGIRVPFLVSRAFEFCARCLESRTGLADILGIERQKRRLGTGRIQSKEQPQRNKNIKATIDHAIHRREVFRRAWVLG